MLLDLLSVAALITSRAASRKVSSSNATRLLRSLFRKLFRFTGQAFSKLFDVDGPPEGLLGSSGRLRLGRLLGASWEPLAAPEGPVGGSRGFLGRLLDKKAI